MIKTILNVLRYGLKKEIVIVDNSGGISLFYFNFITNNIRSENNAKLFKAHKFGPELIGDLYRSLVIQGGFRL